MRKYMSLAMISILAACADGGGSGGDGVRMRRYSKAEVVAYSNAVVTGMQGSVNNSAERTQYAREHTQNPKASADVEFENMHDLLLDGDINGDDITDANLDAWRRALQMAGCDVDEIDTVEGMREFVNGNAAYIRDQASSVYEDNKLTETTIDQVSFDVNDYGRTRQAHREFTFNLDDDGRIQGITLAATEFSRAGETASFAASELGQLILAWQQELGITAQDLAQWGTTEAEIAQGLQKKIQDFVAKNQNRYRSDMKGLIDRLAPYLESDRVADLAYVDVKLYGTRLGQNTLSFADFGIVREYDAPGTESVRDGTVIGGYEDKHLARANVIRDAQSEMKFTGAAIGIVTSGSDKREVSGRATFTFDPTASDGVKSHLQAQFNDWYTVDVDQIDNDQNNADFTFNGEVQDNRWQFAGTGTGGMRSEFYGEGAASEVVGEAWYTEDDKSFQGAFGGKKK